MKTLEELGVSGGDWKYDPDTRQIENATVIILLITDADGRLMAASKKMYEALLAAELDVAQLCEGQDPANECWNTLTKIRAAIAAAKGA